MIKEFLVDKIILLGFSGIFFLFVIIDIKFWYEDMEGLSILAKDFNG